MNRQEFDKKTRVEILQRAKYADGMPRCEFLYENGQRCHSTKQIEVHHNTKMDAMKSAADKATTKLTAADGLALCKDHHVEETAIQRADLAKAIRVEARNLGADKPKRGFAKVSKEKTPLRVANGINSLMRRGFVPAGDSDV
jgi:hypothetical protein